MTTDERNFRSSYYEKVGCHSVEEKKSLDKLLQDKIRNHAKLKQFSLSYTVPQAHRGLLWGIILGVMPLHKSNTEYVWEQRVAVYEDLLRAVKVMQYIDSTTSKSQVFLAMWLCENNRLLYSSLWVADENRNFLEIVKVLLQIFEDDVETYWIAKEFFMCTKEIEKECPKLKELTKTLLKQEDIALHNKLENLNVFDSTEVLDKWYVVCFAGVISESALVKVWDKICGGSRKIVIFLFLELTKALRDSILGCATQSDFKILIEQVKDQDAAIVNKAIKVWQNNKTHNEITVH